MIEDKYAKEVLRRLDDFGFRRTHGSTQDEIRLVKKVLVGYENSKPTPSFNEADVTRSFQKIVTRDGHTGVVLSSRNGIHTIYLDEAYGGMAFFECQPDGKYRDDGGEHELDLMNFELLNINNL